jgi:hypothetical protein
MMHHAMREAMQVARSTVTLDEETAHELESLEAQDYLDEVRRAVESPVAAEGAHRLWLKLVHSVEELGVKPSRSAVIRQALDYYFASIQEARRINRLEEGYAALASDEDRSRGIRAMRNRVPERFRED